ncbi:MAG: hypoxanthine phosphoribosyltransferase [Deltaproteobacteria bacterium]|jgi:hypoxanthine phosphoribosyltransferase|nr:hypoxanthine phosphoribosyltransferase [Deltaproteobacteria bacterium]
MPSPNPALRCVYSREEIASRVRAIGAAVNAEYAGKDLAVICILKGAFMFFSDLLKELTVRPQIDFVRLASYGDGTRTTRSVSFTKDVEISLKDKHVLLVEDVIDSGYTMDFLLRQLKARGAASLKVAVLVDKTERREVLVKPDFVGFHLAGGFIVGYGLDYAEYYREFPAIYEILSDV